MRLRRRSFYSGARGGTEKQTICISKLTVRRRYQIVEMKERVAPILHEPHLAQRRGRVLIVVSHGPPWPDLDQQGCGRWVANNVSSLTKAIEEVKDLDLAALDGYGVQLA